MNEGEYDLENHNRELGHVWFLTKKFTYKVVIPFIIIHTIIIIVVLLLGGGGESVSLDDINDGGLDANIDVQGNDISGAGQVKAATGQIGDLGIDDGVIKSDDPDGIKLDSTEPAVVPKGSTALAGIAFIGPIDNIGFFVSSSSKQLRTDRTSTETWYSTIDGVEVATFSPSIGTDAPEITLEPSDSTLSASANSDFHVVGGVMDNSLSTHLNFPAVQNLSDYPDVPVEGSIVYERDSSKFAIFDGVVWNFVGSAFNGDSLSAAMDLGGFDITSVGNLNADSLFVSGNANFNTSGDFDMSNSSGPVKTMLVNDNVDRDTKIPAPLYGQFVFNVAGGVYNVYDGGAWQNIGDPFNGGALTLDLVTTGVGITADSVTIANDAFVGDLKTPYASNLATITADAVLDFSTENTKGVRFPSMTSAQIAAIASPGDGLVAYDTTTKLYNIHDGTSWGELGAGGGVFNGGTVSGDVNTAGNALNNIAGLSTGATLSSNTAVDMSLTTNAALSIPSVSTTQRNAITAGESLLIYNNTTDTLNVYDGSAWLDIPISGSYCDANSNFSPLTNVFSPTTINGSNNTMLSQGAYAPSNPSTLSNNTTIGNTNGLGEGLIAIGRRAAYLTNLTDNSILIGQDEIGRDETITGSCICMVSDLMDLRFSGNFNILSTAETGIQGTDGSSYNIFRGPLDIRIFSTGQHNIGDKYLLGDASYTVSYAYGDNRDFTSIINREEDYHVDLGGMKIRDNYLKLIRPNSGNDGRVGFLVTAENASFGCTYHREATVYGFTTSATTCGSINSEDSRDGSTSFGGYNSFSTNCITLGRVKESLPSITTSQANSICINDTCNQSNICKIGYMTAEAAPGTNRVLVYDAANSEILQSTVKTFVIDHPTDKDRHLVHGCLEGAEDAVYYNGEDEIVQDSCIVELPDYVVDDFASEYTVSVTPIFNGTFRYLTYNKVNKGKFTVRGEPGKFMWVVRAKRNTDIRIEPLKSESTVMGDGPYRYIV